MSTTPDSTLDPQQLIAELQRQLAESNAERDEALGREAASAEVLQVINSSPGDLAPVFDAVLDKAMRLCEAAFGLLIVSDGDKAPTVAARGVPPAFVAFRREHPVSLVKGPIFSRLLAGEDFVHTIDLKDDDAYRHGDPLRRAMVDLGGGRTSLIVALRRNREVLGTIHIYRQEVRPFSDRQIALLQNFAAQAVIAMENARLITETREALDQQTATAEVLGVINASPGDLAPVFNAILEKAMTLCGAAFGLANSFDGERFHLAGENGVPSAFAEWRKHNRPVFGPGTGPARILVGENVVHTIDLMESEAYRNGDPNLRVLVEFGGARTHLIVALRKDDALLGTLSIYRQEVHPFTDKQISLLQNFAAQAVIAMENARLITETREALEQQTATAEVLQVINSSPGDLTPVFDAILEKAHSLCGLASGSLQLYDGQLFRAVAAHGMPEPLADLLRQPYAPEAGSASDHLLAGDAFYQIADLAQAVTQASAANPRNRLSVELNGVRTLLFVPLRKDDALLGLITAARQEIRPFTDKQIALLQNFAAEAVIAMENARLITETREALEQQTATTEVLQVINSSPGELAPVFDAILEKAHRLCGAPSGSLQLYDGQHFRAVATRGMPEPFAALLHQGYPPHGSNARLLGGDSFVQVADMAEIAARMPGDRLAQATVEVAGIRTLLRVALRKDGALLGTIIAGRHEVQPFSDKQIVLLQNFAAQAVIAIDNARLITETREALEQQTATAEVLQVINSSPDDLGPVFEAMLQKALDLCGADLGGLYRFDGKAIHPVAMQGGPKSAAELLQQSFAIEPGSSVERLIRGEVEVVQVPDIVDTEAYRSGSAYRVKFIELTGARTALWVALRQDEALVGVFVIYRQEVRPFTDKQIALLQNFAAQAVIAMENARLLGELRQRTEEVGELNRDLEARVAEQVDELGRIGRLKRFLAPQLAELIVSQGDEKILESHRREIVVVFCDLRGYTAFTETAEPEEVLDFLRQYHGALGPLVSQFEGTLDQFSGDGIMVFFNDPVPCPDPGVRAVNMAVAMRSAANTLIADWRERGRDLGFGAGIAQGYATLGQIGFSERSGYTAIGTVCNVAARLCAEAKDGQILLGQLVNVALKGSVATEQLGPLALKGLSQPVVAYNVPLGASQPAFRVIEGGPQSV